MRITMQDASRQQRWRDWHSWQRLQRQQKRYLYEQMCFKNRTPNCEGCVSHKVCCRGLLKGGGLLLLPRIPNEVVGFGFLPISGALSLSRVSVEQNNVAYVPLECHRPHIRFIRHSFGALSPNMKSMLNAEQTSFFRCPPSWIRSLHGTLPPNEFSSNWIEETCLLAWNQHCSWVSLA